MAQDAFDGMQWSEICQEAPHAHADANGIQFHQPLKWRRRVPRALSRMMIPDEKFRCGAERDDGLRQVNAPPHIRVSSEGFADQACRNRLLVDLQDTIGVHSQGDRRHDQRAFGTDHFQQKIDDDGRLARKIEELIPGGLHPDGPTLPDAEFFKRRPQVVCSDGLPEQALIKRKFSKPEIGPDVISSGQDAQEGDGRLSKGDTHLSSVHLTRGGCGGASGPRKRTSCAMRPPEPK